MSASHVDFTNEIKRLAAERNKALTIEQVEKISEIAKSLCRIEGDSISVDLGEGRVGTAHDLIVAELAGIPEAASRRDPGRAAPSVGGTPVGPAWARGRTDPFARITLDAAQRERDGLLRVAETWPNPWAKSNLNKTRQAILTNISPAKAAKLKAEAGYHE